MFHSLKLNNLPVKDTLGQAILSTIVRLSSSPYVQWNLPVKDTLGQAILSTIERLSSSLDQPFCPL